jgi:hypothetical protein
MKLKAARVDLFHTNTIDSPTNTLYDSIKQAVPGLFRTDVRLFERAQYLTSKKILEIIKN